MKLTGIISGLALSLTCSAYAYAGGEEVTLMGKIMCARCTLKETSKCVTAIQVKESGKTVTYYFADKGAGESYHEEVCGGGQKAGRVIGTVTEKEGKKYITPRKVEYNTSVNDSSMAPRPATPAWMALASALASGGVTFAPMGMASAAGGAVCPNCRH